MRKQARCWQFFKSQVGRSPVTRQCLGVIGLGVFAAVTAQVGGATAPTWQDKASETQSAASDSETDTANDQQADAECPGLGVVAGCCPGKAMRVSECMWGGPADRAGIRSGDYILSVNGKALETPGELCQMVSKLEPGKPLTVKIWREGDELEKQVPVAERADELPESRRAWLGVILAPGEDGSVIIERVIPESPAAQAGLQGGDQILKSGDSAVQHILSFSETVEEQQVGSQLELTVLRDDQEQQISVTLGDISEASVRELRQAMRLGDMPNILSPEYQEESVAITDDVIDDLRKRLRELEQQVREISGEAAGQVNVDDGAQAQRLQDAGEHNGTALVVQREQRPGAGTRAERGRRDYDRRGRERDQISRYRDPRLRDWRSPSVDNWGSRYRSPYSGNQYYRYRGRPYYYDGWGRGQYYGRPGVRLGNFGFYWF